MRLTQCYVALAAGTINNLCSVVSMRRPPKISADQGPVTPRGRSRNEHRLEIFLLLLVCLFKSALCSPESYEPSTSPRLCEIIRLASSTTSLPERDASGKWWV